MSWGSWILVLVYPLGLLLGAGGLTEEERGRLPLQRALAPLFALADAWRRPLLIGALALGTALGMYTGLLLGAMAARLTWSSALLGPLFLTSGLSTGAALLLLLRLDDEERHALVRLDLAAIVLELVLLGALLIGFATGSAPGRLAFEHLTSGLQGAAFLSLVVIMGLIVPLAMELAELKKKLAAVALSPALVLLGGLSLRVILVLSGQASGFRELP